MTLCGVRERRAAPVSSISPGFGPLLGMSLVSGRWSNDLETPGVAIVNESLARRDFPNADPVGKRIRVPWLGQNGLATIVGVARDLKYAASMPTLRLSCSLTTPTRRFSPSR